MAPVHTDVLVIGAGAAGLATAIFSRRSSRALRVLLVDGARRPGAKILVSGGGRCNVTNRRVTERDFSGSSPASIRRVLKSLPVERTVAFFEELGVRLHEEPLGKLFPDSNRARDVLEALLAEATRVGVSRLDGHRVHSVSVDGQGFSVQAGDEVIAARSVVLATGGQSLPKSGSDGGGFDLARALGHTIVPPVPALVPLVLDAASALPFADLAGITHEVEITVWIDGRVDTRICGSLLWTHVGVSGPAALDVSRHWARATAAGVPVALTLSACPGARFETMDADLQARCTERPRAEVHTILSTLVPSALSATLLRTLGIDAHTAAGALSRTARRELAHALTEWPLPVVGTRGYNHAEVTAGGVPLAEVHPSTLESRICPGLFFAGEVLDVDGRLGGFNFQWAWASAHVAAHGLMTRAHAHAPAPRAPGAQEDTA